MSALGGHAPTRAEVLAIAQRPTPPWVKTAATGRPDRDRGARVHWWVVRRAADRVWRAFHFNWLFFATLSSAGATWAAVQRIVTARWSRPIVRFWEGYAAFLPVAFVFLLLILFVGRTHIFPWSTRRRPTRQPGALSAADVSHAPATSSCSGSDPDGGVVRYTAVRLDVGGIPEAGAGWAAGIRAGCARASARSGARSTRRTRSRVSSPCSWCWPLGSAGRCCRGICR